MNKKEILIIFVLAVLVTGLSCSLINVQCREVCTGWPLVVYESLVGWGGDKMTNIFWVNLILDFLFWFLIVFGIWKVIKCIIKRKLKKR